ncbi:hypothetical protein Tco_1212285 [Tanacetum coccineum]
MARNGGGQKSAWLLEIRSDLSGTDTPYLLDGYSVLGKTSLFFFDDQSIIYHVSLMWIWRILQTRAMDFKFVKVLDTAYTSRMIRRIGLKTSNYDQLYAYLKQHEAHANESKMMLERYTKHAINPLALVSNVSPHQYPSQSSTNPQSAYVPPGRQNRGQGNYARGAVTSGNAGAQNRVGNTNPGQAKQIKCYNCNGENGVILDEEKLLFIAGGHTNMFDDDVDEAPVQDLALDVMSCRVNLLITKF